VSGSDRVADGIHRLGTDWVGWYLCAGTVFAPLPRLVQGYRAGRLPLL
jgi:hypothetical protein